MYNSNIHGGSAPMRSSSSSGSSSRAAANYEWSAGGDMHAAGGAAAAAAYEIPRGAGGAAAANIMVDYNNLIHQELPKLKARIVAHPLYEQLLAAHVACLRAATPAEHFHKIDATLANCHHIASQYLAHAHADHLHHDKQDLDHFMVNYILLLQSFKEQLQHHLTTQASEAIAACWGIEKALYDLTGVAVGQGSGALMPEDEMGELEEELQMYGAQQQQQLYYGGHDRLGLDSFMQPSDAEKSLLQHVRRELKNELKKEYQSKLKDVREEILRKRRAGKLPGDTANILRDWWSAHSKWPYPTEEEKAQLVEETGLELKQINNWFINQRKRNWQMQNSNSPTNTFTYDGSATNIDNPSVDVSLSLNETQLKQNNTQDGGGPS